MTKQGAAARAADLIGAWAEQFIVPENIPTPVAEDSALAIPAVGTRMGVVVHHNDRSVSADRTKKNGGKGQGFTAEGLLMSAVATASTQAIKEAGKAQKIDAKVLEAVSVRVNQESESRFTRTVTLPGFLSADQQRALADAAASTTIDSLLAVDIATTVATTAE